MTYSDHLAIIQGAQSSSYLFACRFDIQRDTDLTVDEKRRLESEIENRLTGHCVEQFAVGRW